MLAPTLFAIFVSAMLQEAETDLHHERGRLRLRTDESVFSLRRPLAGTKTLEKTILDRLFAAVPNSLSMKPISLVLEGKLTNVI